MFWRIKDLYNNIRCWFKYCCNKNHFKTVWKSFVGFPWDHGYTYDVIRARLVEQYEYFKKSNIAVGNEHRAERIGLAIKLYDIMVGDVTAGNFEILTPQEREMTGNTSMVKYVTTKYVNTRNATRFIHPKVIDTYRAYPQYLYEEKAQRLFWRIMQEYSRGWWD